MLASSGVTDTAFLVHFASTAGIGLLVLFMLVRLERLMRRVYGLIRQAEEEFTYQHRRRTPVATIQGLVGALEKGLEHGGLRPEQRQAIYRAIDEQIALFYAVDTSGEQADSANGERSRNGHAHQPARVSY